MEMMQLVEHKMNDFDRVTLMAAILLSGKVADGREWDPESAVEIAYRICKAANNYQSGANV